jgi:DNA polymerase-3 subunit beta
MVRLEIDQKSLKKALALLKAVVPPKSSNPLHTYVHLAAKGGTLSLRGTNGEVDLELSLPARADGEGEALVPGEVLFGLSEGTSGETAALELWEARLYLEAKSFRADLRVAPTAGYPEFVFPEEGEGIPLPAEAFLQGAAQVRYAASKGEYRPIFRGVQLEFREGGLRFVATDGYRLALCDLAHPFPFEKTVVIPNLSLGLVLHVLEAVQAEEVVLRLAPGVLGLEVLGEAFPARVAARLMEGTLPGYEHAIPKEFVAQVLVETRALKGALERLEVLAEKENRRLDFVLGEGQLRASAKGADGEGEEEVPAQVEGALEFSVNARHLLEALPKAERVLIRLSGPVSPMVVAPGDGGGYRAVLVPLRV